MTIKNKNKNKKYIKKDLVDNDIPIPTDDNNIGIASESKKLLGLGFWEKRKLRKKPEHSFLITMIFSNGTSKRFIITTNEEMFKYKNRFYHLRYEDSLFSLTDNQYILFYHEDFVNPIDREVVKKGDKRFFSTTPENIKPIIDMEYVKALSSSIELNKFFRSALVLMILNLLIGLINLFINMKLQKVVVALAGG